MTMAEVEVGEQGAPGADQSSEQADQSAKPVTVEALVEALGPRIEQIVADRVNENGAAIYRGLQGLLDSKVNEIREQFGVDRETAMAMKEAARRQLGDEDYAIVSAQAKAERTEQENIRLRAQAEEIRKAPADDDRAIAQRLWADTYQGLSRKYAEGRTVDLAVAMKRHGRVIEDYPGRTANEKYLNWYEGFTKVVNTIEDEQDQQKDQGKTDLNTTRGGAGPKPDALAAYREALQSGAPLPKPRDIDAATARFSQM